MAFDDDSWAALLCDWCIQPRPGQKVLVVIESVAERAAAALETALLARGAWPYVDLIPAGHTAAIIEHGRELHLQEPNPFLAALNQTLDCVLRVEAPADTRQLAGLDPAGLQRLARLGTQQARLRGLRGEKQWAVSIWPTPALAAEAGMDMAAYADFLSAAMFLDRPDPVAAWRELETRQQELVDRLTGARIVRLLGADTDLTLEVSGRTWINSNGRRNMPSGEVFTSPLEASAQGQIRFDMPSNHGGVPVAGITARFEDGVVVAAHAELGDDRLQAELNSDPGARRLGEIGIGTNFGIDRATGSTLLDEKIGGTVHLALGRSYRECGGLNESAIHWDLVCDLRRGGEIVVDGETLSRDGRFL